MTKKSTLLRALKILLASLLTILIVIWILFAKLKSKPKPLKIGVMPDLDSIQIAVALSFCENTQLVLFTDALSRSAAFRSGAIDLAVSDLLTAATEISGGRNDQILTVTSGRYAVISKEQNINNIRNIGISNGTIIEYIADRHLKDKAIQKVPINSIPARLSAVQNGDITAAVLPEPYATLSQSNKLNILTFWDEENIGIISCNKKVFNKKQSQIVEFLKAFNKAADIINNAPESDVVKQAMDTLSIGEAFGKVKLPTYRSAAPPDIDEIDKVCCYLSEYGICDSDSNAVKKALLIF